MSSIKIISLVTCERLDLNGLAEEIENSLHVKARKFGDFIDPSFAFVSERSQYLSTAILAKLGDIPCDAGCKILGITDVDLFIPILTYVFGEAQLGGKASIVSVNRLKPEDVSGEETSKLLHDRLLKEAKHELGHAFGLIHCRNINCILYPSSNPESVDMKGSDFCLPCRKLLTTAIGGGYLHPDSHEVEVMKI